MQEQVKALLAEFDAGVAAGGDVSALLESVTARMQALSPLTELDAVHLMVGWLEYNNRLIPLVGTEAAQTLISNREQIVELIRRLYGSPETPYLQSREIINRVAHALRDPAANVDDIVAEATSEIESLAFDEQDQNAKSVATVAVQCLQAERNWRGIDPAERDLSLPPVAALVRLELALQERGFDYDAINATATYIKEEGPSPQQTYQIHAAQLMIVLGMGLQVKPDGLPALQPTQDIVIETLARLAQPEPAAEPVVGFAGQCESLLFELGRGLRESGFSEYLFRQCSAGLQELQPETDEDRRVLRESLLRMIDITVPFAPREFADTLLVTREGIVQQEKPPEPPLDAAGIRAEAEEIIARLKAALAEGKSPSPEVARAIMALQALGTRVADDDEDAVAVLLSIMPQVVAVAAPYAPPELRDTAQDVTSYLSQVMQAAPAAMQSEGPETLIEQQEMLRIGSQIEQMVTSDPWEKADAAPYLRRFAGLLRPFMRRLNQLKFADYHPREAAEMKRLGQSADLAMQRMRAATSEEQWVEQQRRSWRRVALDLKQFERRHHLMVIDPPWPSPGAPVDPNAVFFSGSPDLDPLIVEAAGRIGMSAAAAPGLDQGARNRWDQLRRSAAAIFDFSAYDRAASDPAGAVPRSKKQQQAILAAAAPVARVAYECGWAFVLGTPFITLARADRPMPFDIDIEPVMIDSATPSTAITDALQSVIYGVQRGTFSQDITGSLTELQRRFGKEADYAALLESLSGKGDATELRLAAEAMLEPSQGNRGMIVFPAFAPAYPDRNGKPSLFHVTAFRQWSNACQEVLREVCGESVDYRIGYDHLDPDILRAIWNDLCRASFVVADLTHLNPNAVMELGMAQALGRPTLIVTQTPDVPAYLPALQKVRIHTYRTDGKGRDDLAELARRFLGMQ